MSKDLKLSDQKKISETTWLWIMITIFVSPLIMDYLAPFFTLITYIIYKFELKRKGLPYHKFPTYIKVLIIFLIYQFVNILHSGYLLSSLWVSLIWLAMFTAYLFITNIVNSHEKIKKLLYLATLSAGIAGLIGILEIVLIKFNPHTQFFKDLNPFWQKPAEFVLSFIPFHDLPKSLIPGNLNKVRVYNLNQRANSTFSNPVYYSVFLVSILPFSIYCSLFAFKEKVERKKKLISMLCVVFIIGGIAASYTRVAYIAAVACIIIFAFIGKKYAKRILTIFPITIALVLLLFRSVLDRVLTLFGPDKSVTVRTHIFEIAIQTIKKHWLIGIGTGNTNFWKILIKHHINQPHAHNIFLEFWVEGGIFEVAIFLAFCVLLFIELIRLCKRSKHDRELGVTFISSFAGLFICGMTDFIFFGPKILQLFMIIMGLAQAAVFVSVEKPYKEIEECQQADEIKEPPDDISGNTNNIIDN